MAFAVRANNDDRYARFERYLEKNFDATDSEKIAEALRLGMVLTESEKAFLARNLRMNRIVMIALAGCVSVASLLYGTLAATGSLGDRQIVSGYLFFAIGIVAALATLHDYVRHQRVSR